VLCVNNPGTVSATDSASRSSALTFPPVSFFYLQLHAAGSDDSAFANIDDVGATGGYFQRPPAGFPGGGLDRSISEGSRHTRQRPLSTYHNVDEISPGGNIGKGTFQRSVSEMVGIGQDTRLKASANR